MEKRPLNAVLQHIRRLTAAEEVKQLSDGELLQRFIAHRDEGSFSLLMNRHGAMVLRVAQRVLHHQQNAEDVYQATFLTLARKAASIRKQSSVACWLRGVSYRIARRLQADLMRRTPRATGAEVPGPTEQAAGRELQAALDDELSRLSEKHRQPLILCYLEGKTRDEAAAQLGWSLSTLKRRLEKGRSVLAARLTRRGLTLGAAMACSLLAIGPVSAAAVPPTLVNTTCAAVSALAAGSAAGAASATVAGLVDGMVKTLLIAKVKALAAAAAVVVAISGAGVWIVSQSPSSEANGPTPVQQAAAAGDSAPRAVSGAVPPTSDSEVKPALVALGEHTVFHASRCGECHTPRNSNGELNLSKHLQGGFWYRNKSGKGDREHTPDITMSGHAGKWTEERMVKFLTSARKGDVPVSAHKLTLEEARAVAAYLRSLPGKSAADRRREHESEHHEREHDKSKGKKKAHD